MAKSKKRNRSLLELMDPAVDYHATKAMAKSPAKAVEQNEKEKVSPPPQQEPEAPAMPPKPKAEKAQEREPAEKENELEPLLVVENGKLRMVLNYQLAVLVCFLAVIILICAVLVGWKWGQDSAARRYLDQLQGKEQSIDHSLPGFELEESASEIKG